MREAHRRHRTEPWEQIKIKKEIGAGETAQFKAGKENEKVKCSPCKHDAQSLSRTSLFVQSWTWWCMNVVNTAMGRQRQVDPLDSRASQPHLLQEFQSSVKQLSNKKKIDDICETILEAILWPPHACTPIYIITLTHTYEHTCTHHTDIHTYTQNVNGMVHLKALRNENTTNSGFCSLKIDMLQESHFRARKISQTKFYRMKGK